MYEILNRGRLYAAQQLCLRQSVEKDSTIQGRYGALRSGSSSALIIHKPLNFSEYHKSVKEVRPSASKQKVVIFYKLQNALPGIITPM